MQCAKMHEKAMLCNAYAKLQLVSSCIFSAGSSPGLALHLSLRWSQLLESLILVMQGVLCRAVSPNPAMNCLLCLWVSASPNNKSIPKEYQVPDGFPHFWAQMGLHLPPGSQNLLRFNGTYTFVVHNMCFWGYS